MIKLCTLDYVKQLLKIDTNEEDSLLNVLIVAASELIVLHLKDNAASKLGLNDSGIVIDASMVPQHIQIATAMLVGYLKENPTSDEQKAFANMGELPRQVQLMLYMDRDPTLV